MAPPTVVASCRPVEQSELQASTLTQTYGIMNMHTSDGYHWVFGANFYEEATFTLVITAYDAQGNTTKTSLNIPYPFE